MSLENRRQFLALIKSSKVFDLLALFAASLVLFVGLYYAYVVYVFDLTTLLVSVVLPLLLGSAVLSIRRNWVLLFAFLAYFWALIDDAPVFFDSVLTWPEVTRFHPFLPRLEMNIVLHSLTLFFVYLAIRKSVKKGSSPTHTEVLKVSILALSAFVLAYAQNIPLATIQNLVESSWYPFDVTEKIASILVLYFAIRIAAKIEPKTSSDGRLNAKV